MTGNEKSVRDAVIASVVVNLILTVILIPHFGGIGAAIATGTSLVALNIYCIIAIRKRLGFSSSVFLKGSV